MDSYSQLNYQGLEDYYLIGNPQISFFKSVYRRYTNFAVDTKELLFKKNTLLNENTENIMNITLDRFGDLVKRIYFTFELPDIYSGCSGSSTDYTYNYPYEFRWIENIGTNIIDYVNLKINNTEINKLYGEFIHIDSEISLTDSKKKLFNKLVGNIPENTKPQIDLIENNFIAILKNSGTGYSSEIFTNIETNARFNITANSNGNITNVTILNDGNNFKDHDTIILNNTLGVSSGNNDAEIILLASHYPHLRSSSNSQYKINNNINGLSIVRNSEITGNSLENYIPSIKKQKIKVPLNLFFSKDNKLALPLIALQKCNVSLEFKLNPIRYLYTILKKNIDNKIVRIQPDIDITTFIKNTIFDIKPKIEVDYIFLSNDERKRISEMPHEFLIEQTQRQQLLEIKKTKEHRIYFSHPVKELIVISQRSDMESINYWNNYTNWTIENIAPYKKKFNCLENVYYNNNLGKYIFYNRLDSSTTDKDKKFEMKFFDESIVKSIKILFDGNSRLQNKDSEFFNLVQPFEYHKRKIKKGIHIYSFSLNPDNYQPSGSCNFSKIDNFKLEIDLGLKTNEKEIPINSNTNTNYFNYNFNIYAINYNILVISSGLANVKFNN